MFSWKRTSLIAGLVVLLVFLSGGALYRYIVTGGLIARQTPTTLEAGFARWALDLSVPSESKQLKNPLDPKATSGDLFAGQKLYREKCEVCHGYDGGGKTEASAGQFPPPLDFRGLEIRKATDGELFYFIRNGIRNTPMPGWQLPDRQTWQLVVFIRNLPKVASPSAEFTAPINGKFASSYVGSAACKTCHADIYERWKVTRMANVVRDPVEHPDAILPDLSKPDPLLTFGLSDISLVYGSKWKQRYFKKVGDDFFPQTAQWDVINKVWRAYNAKPGTDWWTRYYGKDNFQRPTGPLCDGCHSVNYNIQTKSVTEWNVGCEKCHGPGGDHVKQPGPLNVVNPARLDYVRANDVCIQCHSQGQPLSSPIEGKYYDWPVGYEVGRNLRDFWKLEEHTLGETSFTHFPDGTAHKNRMQGNDYVSSTMYTRGITCFSCHDSHGTQHDALLWKPATIACLDCHGPTSPNGPRAPTIEQHTHHKTDSPGTQCAGCHMPKIEQTIADTNVRSHTFRFIPPQMTERFKMPNSCTSCHTDKSIDWAREALKTWTNMSPWRVN